MSEICDISLGLLDRSIRQQRALVRRWKQPKSPLLFELLRALDYLFVADILEPPRSNIVEVATRSIQSFGVNAALAMMVPERLHSENFSFFQSSPIAQRQSDDLLFRCGALQRAIKFRHEMKYGLLDSSISNLRNSKNKTPGIILELHPRSEEYRSEHVAYSSRAWLQNLQYKGDKPMEEALEREHLAILPDLVKNVQKFQNWGIAYKTSREIDDYFLEWGRLYLRRMWGQDLIGLDDRIGSDKYNEYLGVLVGLAGRAQKHLCYTSILSRRHPELNYRNLLTTFAPYHDFLYALARHLDADQVQVQRICESLTLSPFNKNIHTASGDTAWAPLVRSSNSHIILPVFGLEHWPFRFLLRDLKAKYERDWFAAANRREGRWQAELSDLFISPRWSVIPRGVDLKNDGRIATDVDFILVDQNQSTALLFQLKWQDPVGLDDRAKISASHNFERGGNKWIEATSRWLEKHGAEELGRRAGLNLDARTRIKLIVIGRYTGPIFSTNRLDERAAWTDWATFIQEISSGPIVSIDQLCQNLRRRQQHAAPTYLEESYDFPVGDLTITSGMKRKHAEINSPIEI